MKKRVQSVTGALKVIASGLAQSVAFGLLDFGEGRAELLRSLYQICPSVTPASLVRLEDELERHYADYVVKALDDEAKIDASAWTPEIMRCMALVHGLLKGESWIAVMDKELTIATSIPYEQNVLRISAGRNSEDNGWELCVDDLGTTLSATVREARFFKGASEEKVLSMLYYTTQDSGISVSNSGNLSASFPIDEHNMNSVVEAFAKIKVAMHGFLDAKQNCLDALECLGVVKPTILKLESEDSNFAQQLQP